jgi:hypothetical protein
MERVVSVARFRKYSLLTVVERITSVLGKPLWILPQLSLEPRFQIK